MSLAEEGEAAVGVLASARYGKDKVRVFRVVRDPTTKVHDVVEYNVTVLVEGAIETRCGPRRVMAAVHLNLCWRQLHASGQHRRCRDRLECAIPHHLARLLCSS
jgi:hypothetical protein